VSTVLEVEKLCPEKEDLYGRFIVKGYSHYYSWRVSWQTTSSFHI
jgi:hypothetical protein